MSKSDENPNACILILDEKDQIIKKFKRAVTDSEMEVRYGEGKDGINNLMTIYGAVTGKSMDEITSEFAERVMEISRLQSVKQLPTICVRSARNMRG